MLSPFTFCKKKKNGYLWLCHSNPNLVIAVTWSKQTNTQISQVSILRLRWTKAWKLLVAFIKIKVPSSNTYIKIFSPSLLREVALGSISCDGISCGGWQGQLHSPPSFPRGEKAPFPHPPVRLPSRISHHRIQIDLGVCQLPCWSTIIFWRYKLAVFWLQFP